MYRPNLALNGCTHVSPGSSFPNYMIIYFSQSVTLLFGDEEPGKSSFLNRKDKYLNNSRGGSFRDHLKSSTILSHDDFPELKCCNKYTVMVMFAVNSKD